tara:strand:- start:86 stop:334 length:249 start_codon:yes stop_codon:yes gene_type:complete
MNKEYIKIAALTGISYYLLYNLLSKKLNKTQTLLSLGGIAVGTFLIDKNFDKAVTKDLKLPLDILSAPIDVLTDNKITEENE